MSRHVQDHKYFWWSVMWLVLTIVTEGPTPWFRMWEISKPPRAVCVVHLIICYNRLYHFISPNSSGTPLLAMTFEASYFWCFFGLGVQDADEEVQSLPSLLSRHQRLSGDSSSTVLMRVENSEVSVLLKIPEGAWHPDCEFSLPLEELHISSWDFLGWNTDQPQMEDEHATDPLWCMVHLAESVTRNLRTFLWKGQPSSKLFFFGVRWQCPGDLLRVHQPTPFI